MADLEIFNPDTVNPPGGTYSHVATVRAGTRLVAIAGQVAIGADGKLVGAGDFERQCEQVYANLAAALKAAGGGWENVIQMMTFLTRREDVPRLRTWREREFPRFFPTRRYPPNTLLVVSALANDELLLEVQALAGM
jgi:enamine deaminase RidA (YjgF/YER057c/UK114 family)